MMTNETANSRKALRRYFRMASIGLILLQMLAACGAPRGIVGSIQAAAPMQASQQVDAGRWRGVQHWLYQLQNLDVARAAASGFDLIVTDYSADGSDARRFTPEQVARLQAGRPTGRLVLAYMSIGEAEDYRSYWRPEWRPGHPALLFSGHSAGIRHHPCEYLQPEREPFLLGSP